MLRSSDVPTPKPATNCNVSGLEAALARPASYAHYEQADLALQAAVLAHGIAEGQLFIEANKRVALAAMHTFLLINGLQIEASQEERARWMLDLATLGKTSAEKVRALAARLGESTVPHRDAVDQGESLGRNGSVSLRIPSQCRK